MPDPLDSVPEADYQEQHQPTVPTEAAGEPPVIADKPEADVLEQHQPAPLPDEDDEAR